MPIDKKNGWDSKRYVSNEEIFSTLSSMGPLEPVTDSRPFAGPAQMYSFPGARGRVGFISPLSDHFCSRCNRLRLTADGKLRTCLLSDQETDLKTPLRNGCSRTELQEIITGAILSKPLRHSMLEPSFKKCTRGMSAIGG